MYIVGPIYYGPPVIAVIVHSYRSIRHTPWETNFRDDFLETNRGTPEGKRWMDFERSRRYLSHLGQTDHDLDHLDHLDPSLPL